VSDADFELEGGRTIPLVDEAMVTAVACDVARLRELYQKATEGEWENSSGFVRARNGGNRYEGEGFSIQTSCQWVAECRDGEAFYNWQNNAEFIAAIKNATPALLTIVETMLAAYGEAIRNQKPSAKEAQD
jgi:hypothetical protein